MLSLCLNFGLSLPWALSPLCPSPSRSACTYQHFHYSYVINAGAALAHLRPSWATSERVAWVNTLIRDVNDPNKVDYFSSG